VVDEAQNLSPRAVEELRMLSNFQLREKSLLQSFLLGQPEFRFTLQSEGMQQLRQRVIASYHLGPIDAPETREYVEHRLRTVGWKNDPSFSDEAFAAIYDFSAGIPRKINTLCDRLLLMGYLEELHQISGKAVAEVVAELRNELAPPPIKPAETTPGASQASDNRVELTANLANLERRIAQVEKSMMSTLKLLREVLSLAGAGRMRTTERKPGDKIVAIKD
jgi:general secretion pathway protein A